MGSFLQVPFGLGNELSSVIISSTLPLSEYGIVLTGTENGLILKWKIPVSFTQESVFVNI